MRYQSSTLPENIRKLMNPQDRKAVLGDNSRTMEEIEADNAVKSERVLQERICDVLRLRDLPIIRQRMDRATTGTVGQPDFMFPFNGMFVAWECKVNGGTLTPEQLAMSIRIIQNGGKFRVITCVAEAMYHLQELETICH